MSELDSGGSAFPIISGRGSIPDSEPGMTLRDYFAAKVLQGLQANTHDSVLKMGHEEIAVYAYCSADAMLKARK